MELFMIIGIALMAFSFLIGYSLKEDSKAWKLITTMAWVGCISAGIGFWGMILRNF